MFLQLLFAEYETGNRHNHPNPAVHQATGACMCDCLHVDDIAAILAEKGLDKRTKGK